MAAAEALASRPVACINKANITSNKQLQRENLQVPSISQFASVQTTVKANLFQMRLLSKTGNKQPLRSPSQPIPISPIIQAPIHPRQRRPQSCTVNCSVSADTSTAAAAYHELPDGKRLEVLERRAEKSTGAPVVFVHGSYHAAWCWEEHWMGYFAKRGRDTYAVSLLGQGNSSIVDGSAAGTIFSHAEAIADVIKARVGENAVLVGHSFGGLVVQAYLARTTSGDAAFPPLVAAALLCSVPPTGNSEMVKRITLRTPLAAMRLTWSLAAKGFAKSLPLCRESFFSPDMPDADVSRYQRLLAASSKQPLIDLRALSRDVPVTRPREGDPPVMVMAAANDFVVDKEGWEETAAYFWTEAVVVPNMGHDVMLDVRWKDAADRLLDWLSEQESLKSSS